MKTYRPGAPAAVTVEPGTAVNDAGEEHCVAATVRDEFGNVAVGGKVSGQEEYQDHAPRSS